MIPQCESLQVQDPARRVQQLRHRVGAGEQFLCRRRHLGLLQADEAA